MKKNCCNNIRVITIVDAMCYNKICDNIFVQKKKIHCNKL